MHGDPFRIGAFHEPVQAGVESSASIKSVRNPPFFFSRRIASRTLRLFAQENNLPGISSGQVFSFQLTSVDTLAQADGSLLVFLPSSAFGAAGRGAASGALAGAVAGAAAGAAPPQPLPPQLASPAQPLPPQPHEEAGAQQRSGPHEWHFTVKIASHSSANG